MTIKEFIDFCESSKYDDKISRCLMVIGDTTWEIEPVFDYDLHHVIDIEYDCDSIFGMFILDSILSAKYMVVIGKVEQDEIVA